MSARKINLFFADAGLLSALSAEARRLDDWQKALLKAVPPALAESCRTHALRDDVLVLLADNAAVAMKLKQLAPRLLTSFRKQGFKATSIQVRVQVDKSPTFSARLRKRQNLSKESIENVEKLAEGLEDSPLKRALNSLTKNQKKPD